ncbi:bifunctional DNA primase/polymerase [Nitrosopumilus sp.]|uniref:bifunctional DNA primase/polymerase n=1 Tax=Nitrosopumilus sp. TaxID=2024843 RepID=UPI003D0EC95A
MTNIDIEGLSKAGINLMPLKKDTKVPMVASWTELQSKKYTGDFPDNCNVAIICGEVSGGLFVVDLDDASLLDDWQDYVDRTRVTETGKGYHIWFRALGFCPPNRQLEDKRGRTIDLKSEGGYVLAPGSFYVPTDKEREAGKYPKEKENGFEYKLISDKSILRVNANKILEKLKDLGFNTESKTYDDIEQGLAEGGRNDGTFKLACHYVRDLQLHGEALRYKLEEVNARHKPPLDETELDVIIQQAMRYESSNIEQSPEIIGIETLKTKILNLPKDTDSVNLSKDFPDHVKQLGEETVTTMLKKYIPDIKITTVQRVKLRDLEADVHEGIPVEFDAMIIAVGERGTYTVEADYQCPKCNKIKKGGHDQFRNTVIPFCLKCKLQCEVIRDTMKTSFIQPLRIQEFLDDTVNNTPVEYDAEIIDKSIGKAFISDRKTFVAKFRSIPARGKNIIIIEIMGMRDLDQKEGCMPDDTEIEKWKTEGDIFTRVRDSISPELYLNPTIKESLMLSAIGGTSFNGKRALIHVCMLGDAQTGKSELLKKMHTLVLGSGMAVGGKVSGAGLTMSMVKLFNGTSVPQAGLLPTHTGKPVMFDEGDKSDNSVLNSLLECMEQETATLVKSGTGKPGKSLAASCEIMFAANPKGGRYNPKLQMMDNFSMETPFVSRFDILWLMLDINDPETDKIVRKIIRNYGKNKDQFMDDEELQRYFSYTRSLKPEMSEEIWDKVDALHEKMRALNKPDSIPIGWRQYYGLERMLTASAAAHLRDKVTDEDFKIIERIVIQSFKSFGLNIETGVITKPLDKANVTKNTVILETWGEIADKETGYGDKDDFINKLAEKEGFDHMKAIDAWTKVIYPTVTIDADTQLYKRNVS